MKSITKSIAITCLTAGLTLSLVSNAAYAEMGAIGSDEYRISCLSCHGVGGRGNGPLAKFLNTKPTDLTMIAKNNGGHYPDLKAGTYPFIRVYQVIDGRANVGVHGDRAMPVWGNRYLIDEPGGYTPFGGQYEKVVRGRILELVYYIQTLQQP